LASFPPALIFTEFYAACHAWGIAVIVTGAYLEHQTEELP